MTDKYQTTIQERAELIDHLAEVLKELDEQERDFQALSPSEKYSNSTNLKYLIHRMNLQVRQSNLASQIDRLGYQLETMTKGEQDEANR